MKILLDTHILLWCLTNDRRLPQKARLLVETPRNTIMVSSASIWELAVKRALGKLWVQLSDLEEKVLETGFEPLPVSMHHAVAVAELPPYHGDPFDRMLLAQCIVESSRLLTHDTLLQKYGKMVMVV